MKNTNLSACIDHTNLRTDCTRADLEKLCAEAIEHQFAAVCIPPYFVEEVARILQDKNVKVATVAGFPLGFQGTFAKVEEIKRAVAFGADEVDVVVNIAAVKDNNRNHVKSDLDSCVSAAHIRGKTVKIILETALLTEAEILWLCEMCAELNVDFVKTSTGKEGGATVEIVKFLRKNLPENIKIKASGGIRDAATARAMIAAGADRLGTSSGVKIAEGAKDENAVY